MKGKGKRASTAMFASLWAAGLLLVLVQCGEPSVVVPSASMSPTGPVVTSVPTQVASPTPSATLAPFQLTAATEITTIQGRFDLNGLYADTAVGFLGGNITTIDLNSGNVRQITQVKAGGSVGDAQISARWITWFEEHQSTDGTYSHYLMVYDRLQDRKFPLEGADTSWSGTDLAGDIVIWVELIKSPSSPQGVQADILAQNLLTGQKWAIATGPSSQRWPQISEQWIIYLDFEGEAGRAGYANLWAYHLTTGEVLPIGQVPAPPDSSAGTYATIVGHKVVWCGTTMNGKDGLHVYDLETQMAWPLLNVPACSFLEPFGDDALLVGRQIYRLEDGQLLGIIDVSALEGDVISILVSGDRVLMWTEQSDTSGNTPHLYTLRLVP